MKVVFEINDEMSPVIQQLLANNKTTLRRATKSVGWWLQDTAKKETKQGAPGGLSFKARTPHKRVRQPLGGGHAPTSWYGKMRYAMGYEYNNGVLNVGWVSHSSARYAEIQEYGAMREVTEKVRKKYFAAGVPINKKEIKIPARPIFEPLAHEMFPKISSYVEEKVTEYMTKDVEYGKKKSKREYKVYNV